MKPLTQTGATDGQLKQVTRVATDAAEKAIAEFGLDKDGAQRVHAHGDKFAEAIRTAVTTALKDLSVSNKFKDEEVESRYGYLSGYKPKGLTEQTNRLRELFPGIGYANEKLAEGTPPPNAEGWFAIPRWEKIAPTYNEAVQKVLDLIKQTRNGKFENYREGQLDEKRLRESARTQKFFRDLSEAQGNPDILIVPAQFGIRHRGRSVRRAREVFLTNEFGLGAFAVGIMVLTHPERLQHYDDLWVDCAGDEFDDPGSYVRFDRAPYFNFDGVKVRFGTRHVDCAYDFCGSAPGLVPQK